MFERELELVLELACRCCAENNLLRICLPAFRRTQEPRRHHFTIIKKIQICSNQSISHADAVLKTDALDFTNLFFCDSLTVSLRLFESNLV